MEKNRFCEDTPQFFGIVNTGNTTRVLVGPFETENQAFNKLYNIVEEMMANPTTELIPNEDTAIIYERMDNHLLIVKQIDIYDLLETDDE